MNFLSLFLILSLVVASTPAVFAMQESKKRGHDDHENSCSNKRINLCSQHEDLHAAAQKDCLDCCNRLLEKGSNVNAQNSKELTPLHVAASYNALNVAKLLIQHGALCNCRDAFHITPLQYASMSSHLAMVKLLLGHDMTPQERIMLYIPKEALIFVACLKHYSKNNPAYKVPTPLKLMMLELVVKSRLEQARMTASMKYIDSNISIFADNAEVKKILKYYENN